MSNYQITLTWRDGETQDQFDARVAQVCKEYGLEVRAGAYRGPAPSLQQSQAEAYGYDY